MFENPRRGRQARNFTTNIPKILDFKSSSEQIFSENWRWVPLKSIVIASITNGQLWLSIIADGNNHFSCSQSASPRNCTFRLRNANNFSARLSLSHFGLVVCSGKNIASAMNECRPSFLRSGSWCTTWNKAGNHCACFLDVRSLKKVFLGRIEDKEALCKR